MSPFDLSIRYKIPLWGSLLIIASALVVSVTLMVNTYQELEEDLVIDALTLSDGLRSNLFSALQQDNVWHGYETVSAPLRERQSGKAENIIVVGSDLRIFVAAKPAAARMLTPLPALGPEYRTVAERIRFMDASKINEDHITGDDHLFVITPIANEGVRLGHQVTVLKRDSFLPRFMRVAGYGLLASLLVLAILLPINWYWGWKIALPLVELTRRMESFDKRLPDELDASLYAHSDELGSLFKTYNHMLLELKARERLERQVVQSERLAALGQLAAGVAHEINNPLGGMLIAIDTLKSHSVTEPRAARTIALLERGLGHIKDTVGALLVEARLTSRKLTRDDLEDVRVLVLPQARKKAVTLAWHDDVDGEVALPATLVRQVLINLLLNAIKAADASGQVDCRIVQRDGHIQACIANDGRMLSAEQLEHLFEPFSPLSEDGNGLGLWVSYQITRQLGGTITALREGGLMRFTVDLPIGVSVP